VLLLAREGVHLLQVENKNDLKSRRLLNNTESLVLLCLLAKGYTVSRQVHEEEEISNVVVY
jgi:hypothetical protein